MNRLESLILEKIRENGGKIPFSRYMDMVLYTPELGYYMKFATPFGREGDFITAPEVSPLFGKSVANAIQPVLSSCQNGILLEIGAGSGKLAKTLLEVCPDIQQYWILEISPALRQSQKNILDKYLSKIRWLEKLPEMPFEGVILANEVIDAFPATRFCLKDERMCEYYVCIKENHFAWCLDVPSDPALISYVQQLPIESPYSSECHLNLAFWLKDLERVLGRGAIFIVDYGFPRQEFYHPERCEGTLMCHYQQKAHADPFYLPGLQDITAHVDFTAVAEGAMAAGLEVCGYTSQAAFLLACDILKFAKTYEDTQAIKRLTLPSEMGELFKVMVLSKNYHHPLRGFELQDRRNRL